ncbi:hypothetical protein GYB29_08220 [bacterium]|nr:hypothetical protein [bacterium]
MQSPTDGEVAFHHFAESGVMELAEIILKVFVRSDAVLNFSPERIIPASQAPPDHAHFSVLNTKGNDSSNYHY